ncbi:DEAD/DEAH box helicase [Proteiniphilum sp. UBA1028]|uniref:DEAD/DEAH box helicase n=1 Tax=Proteiniphilum sp. UBA1028 TaxID=1947251 RepID=UPI0025E6CEA2|nr:AAA domain-containing protein [Proteiniphilum sp. UBA1028]
MIDLQPYIDETNEVKAAPYEVKKKLHELKCILERLCRELTKEESLQFPTLFSRLVFVAQKYSLPRQLEWHLQHFRVRESYLLKDQAQQATSQDFKDAVNTLMALFTFLQTGNADVDRTIAPEETVRFSFDRIRVYLSKIEPENNLLRCVAEENPQNEVTVRYEAIPENNSLIGPEETFWEGAQLNLIDCIVDKNGYFVPRYIVLEPDYLIDASAIAECFQNYAVSPLHYFRNKLEEKENRSYLLLGNLANFFLDELVYAGNPDDVSFDDVFLRSFKQSPFEYTSCEDIRSDKDFREFMRKAKDQFEHIKRVIRDDFPKRGIDVDHCTLEPSFFSEKFGFQGRLDLLHMHPDEADTKIVELKSGKLPFPTYNKGKIALNHEVQTAVYRMMVESVFGKDARQVDAAILYSAGNEPGENLRFAAVYKELEKKIIHLRNRIVAIEHAIIHGDNNQVEELFDALCGPVDPSQRLPGFYLQKLEQIRTVLSQSSELERAWLYRYIRFISRELYLQKTGDVEYETPTGLASLWNSHFEERAASLDVLFNLSITDIDDSGNERSIIFSRSEADHDIVNFREGEICIVYPRSDDTDTVLNRQILKGTLVEITQKHVEVRFRYKQKNRRYFDDHPLWAIEHDTLDSSCNSMFKSIFSFLKASKQKRDLLLGLRPPGVRTMEESRNKITSDSIIDKIMHAEDYFLLVGPPGTGKTSIFARRLIEEYYKQPDTNILVLAYTNRAVDELCDAINAAFGCSDGSCETYIRVGTELSCAGQYRHRLLQRISEKATNRESLRREIQQTRIYVSTLASITGRMELFSLKHFHVAIIDEASQILEPQIIGLLPRFDQFIMIGDHNQLSTIVLQKPILSKNNEPALCNAGLIDCRDSLFERLLRQCRENGWQHAYAQLTQQGRMHIDIARFPATWFYSDSLFPASEWQTSQWDLTCSSDHLIDRSVASERTVFFSTEKINRLSSSNKLNEIEAEVTVQLLQSIQTIYEENGLPFHPAGVGIIAPYRNQIALIKHKLSESGIRDVEEIMIDTVERFQGSQRDVVILSFCINKPYQLNYLSNLNHDGTVDRKLNVAITRARHQLFLIGNGKILQQHPVYATLLDYYRDKLVLLDKNRKDWSK